MTYLVSPLLAPTPAKPNGSPAFFISLSGLLILGQTAFENGLALSITVLALFLSYKMLNICDLSTDGCFTLGATVGGVVALSGHPYLSIFAAMGAGILSGFVTALLQTKMGVDSLLAGIIVNTGLYSVNIAVMKGAAFLNLNQCETVFTKAKLMLRESFLAKQYKLFVLIIAVALVVVFLSLFLKTRLGLSLRATGNNMSMVKASSINTDNMIILGLCLSGSLTALSGCLTAQMNKSTTADIGNGNVTIALASLLIGEVFLSRGSIHIRAIGAVLGSVVFQIVYAIAVRMNMPAFMLKLVSSVIVVLAIFIPYLKKQYPSFKRQLEAMRRAKNG